MENGTPRAIGASTVCAWLGLVLFRSSDRNIGSRLLLLQRATDDHIEKQQTGVVGGRAAVQLREDIIHGLDGVRAVRGNNGVSLLVMSCHVAPLPAQAITDRLSP